jgi:hypothetical protein
MDLNVRSVEVRHCHQQSSLLWLRKNMSNLQEQYSPNVLASCQQDRDMANFNEIILSTHCCPMSRQQSNNAKVSQTRKFDAAMLHRETANVDFVLVPPASHHHITKAVKADRVTLTDPIASESGNMEAVMVLCIGKHSKSSFAGMSDGVHHMGNKPRIRWQLA